MDFTTTQLVAAFAMIAVGIALVFSYRYYLAANSDRRMKAMLEAVGLDPDITSIGGIETIMSEARQRCDSCNSESVCERWLQGEEDGDNEFCPNSRLFEVLKKYRGDTPPETH